MAQTLGIYEDTEDQVSALRQKYAPKPAQDLGNSISPKVEQYYRDQYDYFKTTGDLPAYKSNEEIDAMQMPVKKETSALGRGFSNLADYAGFNITEDPEYIKSIAETNATKPFAQQMFEKRLGNKFTNIADAYGKDDFSGIAQNVIDTAGELGSNPGKLLSFMGEQAANQLPAIGGRLAGLATGAAIGSTFGPVGAVIGGLVGGFAGGAAGGFGTDYIAEKAAGVLEKVEDPNNIDEIRKVVMDSDVMDDVRKAARLHATEVGLTDAAVGLLTAGLVRSRLGTGFKTTTGLGLETAGEGYGEYRGQTAQVEAGLRESIDPADIGLEAIGGMATSAATVAMELPFGPAKDPALAEAKKISDLRLRVDPSKTPDVDYTQVVNPITKDKIEDSDIAKSAYKIAKYNKLPVGTQGKRVADDNIVQLIDKYILTDNPDVNNKRHAEDVVMSAGYGPTLERMQEEYTSAVKTNENKTENKKTKQEVKQEVVEKNLELNQSPDVTPETPQKEKPTYKVKSKGKTVTIVTDPSRYKTIKGLDRAEKNLRNWIDIRTKSSQPVPQWANDAIEKYRVQRAVLQPTTPDTVEETNLNTIKDVVQNVQGETGREVAGTEIPTAVKPATDWRAELDKNLEVDNDAKVSKILERAGILEQVKARTDTPTIQDLTEEEVQQLDNTYSGGPEGVARIQALTGAATPEQAVAEGKQTTEKIKRTWVAKPNGQAYTSASGAKNSLKTVNKDLDPKKYEVREIEKGSKKYALYPVDSEAGYKIEKKKGGYKTRIQSNVPFTPLTNAGDPVVNLSGSVNINGEMTPYTTTGRVQHDGEKIVIELDNGSWVDPKQYNIKVPFNAIDKAAPKVDEGGVVVQEKSQAEQAKVEEQQARQIEQEKKVAKQVESAEKAREKARQSITAKYESLVAKKPELGEMTDAQLQDFVQEVDNISEIRKPELRAKIAAKVAERFSAMMGIPVTVQDITTVAEAYDEGVITPAEVAPQTVEEDVGVTEWNNQLFPNSIFHTIRNLEDIPNILSNGLKTNTNVGERKSQATSGPFILVYSKDDLALKQKSNPGEFVVTQQQKNQPWTIAININDLALKEGSGTVAEFDSRVDALTKKTGFTVEQITEDYGYYYDDIRRGNSFKDRNAALAAIREKYKTSNGELVKLIKDFNLDSLSNEEGIAAETLESRLSDYAASLPSNLNKTLYLIDFNEDGSNVGVVGIFDSDTKTISSIPKQTVEEPNPLVEIAAPAVTQLKVVQAGFRLNSGKVVGTGPIHLREQLGNDYHNVESAGFILSNGQYLTRTEAKRFLDTGKIIKDDPNFIVDTTVNRKGALSKNIGLQNGPVSPKTKAEPEQIKQEVVQVAQDNITKVQNEIAVSDKRFIANLPEQISYQDEDGETEFIDTILQEDGVTSVFVEEVDDYVPIDQISVADRVEYLKKYSDVGRDYTATAKTTIDAIDGVQDAQDELEQTTLEESGITEIKDPEASAQEQTTNQPTIIRTRQPISKAQSNYIRRRLYPMVSKLLNNVTDLDVIFVESAEDLKAYPNLQADNFSADGTRISTADGWFVELIHPDTRDKNLVIMMLDSKSNPEDVKRVLFHEVVGHYGMRKVLGDQQDGKWTKFLRKTVVTNRKAADAAFALKDRWAKHYLKKDADGKYTLVRDSEDKPFVVGVKQQGYIPVTDKNGNTMYAHADTMTKYMDEYIAEEAKKFVENKPTSKSTLAFFKRIIAYIRHSLRSVLGGELASKVTDNDIASLLETSYIRLFEDKDYLTLIDKSAQKTIAREGKGATKYLTGEINKVEPTWVPYQEASEQPGYSGVAASEGYGATNIQEIIDATLTQESSIGIIRQWRDNVTKLQTWISQLPIINKLSTNRGASKEFALNTLMRTARGKIYKAEMATRPLFKWMTKLDRPKLNEIMEAWLEGTPFTQITGLTRDQQRQLLTARNVLEDAQLTFNGIITGRTVDPETGDETVRKMLPDKWLDNTQGKYIHTMFFNTLHEYSGSGKAPSNMNYFKKKIANPVARAVLGEIKNPGMSIPYTVSLLARDAYLSRLMQDIVENSHDHNTHWTLDSRKTYSVDLPSGKRRLSLNSMKGRMDTIVADLNREDTLLTSPEQVEGLQRELEVLGQKYNEVKDEQLEQVKQAMIAEGGKYSTVTPTGKLIRVDRQPTDEEAQQYLDDNYVWVTKSSNPGLVPFHNKYVHKAVFEEFGSDTPLFDYETGGNSITAKLFKDMTRRGGMMEQGTMMWKLSKTGLNIPTYWIRNLVGNWFLLDTASSTPTALLAKTLSSEIADTLSGAGRRYGQYNLREWAAEFGVYSTTYGASELYFLKDKYQDWVKQDEAREHGNVFQMMGYGVKSSYIKFAEAVSEYHGVMEGIFKQTAMRDYVNRWEKQNGSFARLSPEAQRGVMAGAAEFAEEAIFDYQKVPEWVRRLRRTPLGTPFLTFNYKMASQLPRAMLKHPWKLGKYYAAPAVAASMLMGDMDEDEWEKVKEDLPWHMKNKSSVFVMPTKDANGKYQYWDMTYQYPSAFWIDMVLKVSNPQYDETWYGNLGSATTSDLGFLGGPVPQLVAAVLTNQDPFTKREIVPEGASEKEKMEARLTWLYSLWMPPSVTNTGVLGRSLNQAGIDLPLVSTGESLTKYGSDKETISQTIWRAAGFGAGGWSPQESRLSNYKRYQYQLSLITKRQASILKDRNMDVNKKQKLLAETHARIKDLRKHYAGE